LDEPDDGGSDDMVAVWIDCSGLVLIVGFRDSGDGFKGEAGEDEDESRAWEEPDEDDVE
jgi:hypothetical protein